MITIDTAKCIGCNLCALLCPVGAITEGEVDQNLCIGCLECRNNCPEGAVKAQGGM